MPELITIEAIPKQDFSVTLGGNNYDISIVSNDGFMSYDLSINDEVVILGFKFVNEVLMLPYRYQELNGNLLLVVPEDELPNYEAFGLTQFLVFLDAEETEAYIDNTSY